MRMPTWGAADVVERLELITKLRWAVWAVVLLGILVIDLLSNFSFPIVPILLVAVFVLVYNFVSMFLLKSTGQKLIAKRDKNAALLAIILFAVLDLCVLAAGIYFTGGMHSPYLLLLLVCILSAGIIFLPPTNYVVATIANLFLVAVTLFGRQSANPGDGLYAGAEQALAHGDFISLASTRFNPSQLAMLVLFASLSYLGVYIVTNLAQQLRKGQQEVNRVLQEQEKTVTQLAVLQQIGTEISLIAELDTVLDLIVRKAQGLFSTDMAFLALQEQGSDDVVITVTVGEKTDVLKEIKTRPGQGMGGVVLVSGEPMIVEDYATDPRLVGRPLYANREIQLKSGMAAPLSVGQRRIGVLYVFNRETTSFDAGDAEMLLALANHAAIAIENARLYEGMREASLTDGLTGLHNSRYLQERLTSEVSRVARYGGKLALLMADADSLQELNDRFGRQVGDELLVQLGRLMKDNLRESDVVTRYGGDEFVILLPEADAMAAQQAAERLRSKIAYTQLNASGMQLIITVSIGIAAFPDDASSAEDMLRKADNALGRAKSMGKNRVCVVQPAL